ncbi:hypothetical protein PHJA_002811000 [Phtheirospermum japonicum]|uniref:Uncharacterized protein n=1 Tax=Phtheirospermum japonicum TaxID=374723 RepID=A0A830D5X1_9LAMI|nr:hypothetical protein PHJA_002811000 [Phtheirospermum japonicum]
MDQNDAVSTPVTKSCSKRQYDEHKSFLCNLKNHFQEFIDTPMKDHKECFKLTWEKMVDKFSPKTTSPEEELGNHNTDLQPASRN